MFIRANRSAAGRAGGGEEEGGRTTDAGTDQGDHSLQKILGIYFQLQNQRFLKSRRIYFEKCIEALCVKLNKNLKNLN